MSADEEAQVRHIYERWHATTTSQDLGGLMALYAEHAVFESPTVLAQFPDRDEGILRGRGEIEQLFARNFTNLRKQFSELYWTGLFFSNGRHLTWEYPRLTPSGARWRDRGRRERDRSARRCRRRGRRAARCPRPARPSSRSRGPCRGACVRG